VAEASELHPGAVEFVLVAGAFEEAGELAVPDVPDVVDAVLDAFPVAFEPMIQDGDAVGVVRDELDWGLAELAGADSMTLLIQSSMNVALVWVPLKEVVPGTSKVMSSSHMASMAGMSPLAKQP